MTPDVQRYLVERLDALREQRHEYGAGHDHVRSTLSHAAGGMEALRAAGAVSDSEFTDWIRRIGEAAGLILPPPDAPRGLYPARFVEDPPKPGAPPAPPPASTTPPVEWDSYARFIRLLPGPDDELMIAGGRFRVLGLELYDKRMRLHWRIAPPPDVDSLYAEDATAAERDSAGLPEHEREELRFRRRGHQQGRIWHELTVTDDVGTAYQHIGAGSSGYENEILGTQVVVPGPPASAAVVTVELRGARFDIPLRTES